MLYVHTAIKSKHFFKCSRKRHRLPEFRLAAPTKTRTEDTLGRRTKSKTILLLLLSLRLSSLEHTDKPYTSDDHCCQ